MLREARNLRHDAGMDEKYCSSADLGKPRTATPAPRILDFSRAATPPFSSLPSLTFGFSCAAAFLRYLLRQKLRPALLSFSPVQYARSRWLSMSPCSVTLFDRTHRRFPYFWHRYRCNLNTPILLIKLYFPGCTFPLPFPHTLSAFSPLLYTTSHASHLFSFPTSLRLRQ